MNKLLIAIFLISGVNQSARAGIYLEPYAGYNIGTLKYELALGNILQYTVDDSLNGLMAGGRIGWEMGGLRIAGDYSMSVVFLRSYLSNSLGDTTKEEFRSTRIGAIVGYRLLPMITPWIGYIAYSKMDVQNTQKTFFEGTGYKFGIGLTPLPVINFNIEYLTMTYGDARVGSATVRGFKDTNFLLSVSIPYPGK